MTYLVSQLWFCLLLAWMLGNIVGWLLRGGCSAHIKRVEQNWRDRYLTLEEEKESYVAQVNELQLADSETDTLTEQLAKYQEIEQLNAKLRSHVKDVEIGAQVIQADLRAKTQALAKCQNLLLTSKKVIQTKDETLQRLAKKLKIERHQLNRYKQQVVNYQAQESKRIKTVKTELETLGRDVASRTTELSNAQALLTEKDQSLETLTETVTSKDEIIAANEKQIAEKDESVEMLNETLKIRDEMVEYYEKQLEEHSTTNTTLNNKLDGLANEFAKVASAMMKSKSKLAEENKRYQTEKTEKEALATRLQAVEEKLIDTDKILVEKERALQLSEEEKQTAIVTLQQQQSQSAENQEKSSHSAKLYKLERQLKQMKKKLKAANDVDRIVNQTASKSTIDDVTVLADKKVNGDNKNSKMTAVVTDLTSLAGINYEIEKIRGIGTGYGQHLRELGIKNSHHLLQSVTSDQQAQELAEKLSCKTTDILLWKKMADFLRIKGVNAEFAQLLALSHLHSAKDVADSNAVQLLDKMKAARKQERRIRHIPELADINEWIHHAKTFD